EAGATPVKLQLSACPEVIEPGRDRAAVRALRAMAEPCFLHQTTWRTRDGNVTRLEDLDALDPADPALDAADCLRTHFHIPIHRPPLTAGIGSTIDGALAALPAMCAAQPCQLCVETYTWSVLTADHEDRSAGVAAELAFLAEALSTR
ncbi:MAG: xylose isomerase, partial [Planctomycetota bacterium]